MKTFKTDENDLNSDEDDNSFKEPYQDSGSDWQLSSPENSGSVANDSENNRNVEKVIIRWAKVKKTMSMIKMN